MGKRSTSTTKSGKFMNPTDQARKEARRRELKKNKKQRLLVRQAVLKGKDIATIFTELEKIDQMEFNPVQTAPLSEKVLKEKRKKLRDTLNRVMRLYEKEDPTQWSQIKAMEVQYEKRRAELIIYCESVKHAQSVNLEEIPLPNLNDGSATGSDSLAPAPTHGILKKISAFGDSGGITRSLYRRAPGVPSVPPPELRDIWDEGDRDGSGGVEINEPGIPGIDDQEEGMDGLPPYHTYYQFIRQDIPVPAPEGEYEDEEAEEQAEEGDEDKSESEDEHTDEEMDEEEAETNTAEQEIPAAPKIEPTPIHKPTSLQQRMLAIAGQDVDSFMKEMEVAHRQREMNRQVNLENRLARLERGEPGEDHPESDYPPPPPGPPPGPPQMHPYPPSMGFQRPPMPYPPMGGPPPRPGSVYGGYGQPPVPRLPPGPPPRLPQGVPPRMGMRPPGMPPPPPPGLRAGTRPPMSGMGPAGVGGGSVAAKPSTGPSGKPMTVIEAKPQMRNLSADLTRFVPTTLKLKKEAPVVKKAPEAIKSAPRIEWRVPQPPQAARPATQQQPAGQTKDDAYSQFMKEMHQLIN